MEILLGHICHDNMGIIKNPIKVFEVIKSEKHLYSYMTVKKFVKETVDKYIVSHIKNSFVIKDFLDFSGIDFRGYVFNKLEFEIENNFDNFTKEHFEKENTYFNHYLFQFCSDNVWTFPNFNVCGMVETNDGPTKAFITFNQKTIAFRSNPKIVALFKSNPEYFSKKDYAINIVNSDKELNDKEHIIKTNEKYFEIIVPRNESLADKLIQV